MHALHACKSHLGAKSKDGLSALKQLGLRKDKVEIEAVGGLQENKRSSYDPQSLWSRGGLAVCKGADTW